MLTFLLLPNNFFAVCLFDLGCIGGLCFGRCPLRIFECLGSPIVPPPPQKWGCFLFSFLQAEFLLMEFLVVSFNMLFCPLYFWI